MAKALKEMIATANATIETLSAEEALKVYGRDDTVFVDLRDTMELAREGLVPGAVHIPRGMLEFAIDAESPAHNPLFSQDMKVVFYCGSGGRSALAALSAHQLGFTNCAHMAGGYAAWKQAGGPVMEKG